MAALDTNVLVRLLVEDDARQSAAARKLVQEAVGAGETLFVPVTVTLEFEWVLRSGFGFRKPDVVSALSWLLSSVEMSFESEGAIEVALVLYSRSPADFADCLHVALAARAGERPLRTFDKAASKVEGAQLLAA